MAASSYAEVVRTVRLYASTAPLFLVREWVNAAYKTLCSKRRWSFLVGETSLVIQDARTLTNVTLNQGSNLAVTAGLFLAADVGRQFRVGTSPYYTIIRYIDATLVHLDRVYGETSTTTATGEILDALIVLPADFASFRTIADPYNRRPVPFWTHPDQALLRDPVRQYSGTPDCLIPATPSPDPATLGQIRYEIYPASLTARSYPVRYNKQEDNLTDGDVFTGVLKDGGQVLVEGALAAAAEWPGTPDQKNPYFNLQLGQVKVAKFLDGIQALSLRDDEIAPDDLLPIDWSTYDSLARTDQALRASDATVADYY